MFTAISCPTTSVCFTVGVGSSEQNVGEVTTNGGGTWSSLVLPSTSNYPLDEIACPDTEHCMAVGDSDGDAAISTEDGGSTWTNVDLPSTGGGIGSIWCTSDLDCFVTGNSVNNGAAFVDVTTNGGMTWTMESVPIDPNLTGSSVDYDLSGITCPTAEECVAVGNAWVWGGEPYPVITASWDIVATSTDGGSTWQEQTLPD
jgi:hypothetical protein